MIVINKPQKLGILKTRIFSKIFKKRSLALAVGRYYTEIGDLSITSKRQKCSVQASSWCLVAKRQRANEILSKSTYVAGNAEQQAEGAQYF